VIGVRLAGWTVGLAAATSRGRRTFGCYPRSNPRAIPAKAISPGLGGTDGGVSAVETVTRSVAAPILALVLLAGLSVGCGGDSVDRASATAGLQACLQEQGADVQPVPHLASTPSIDADSLDVDLEASDLTVFVTDGDSAAETTFDALAETIGAGADPLDFFIEGPVVVLFGEESTPQEAELVRNCVRQATSERPDKSVVRNQGPSRPAP
jgi:hypothetical protein